jgi:hypothetical protein
MCNLAHWLTRHGSPTIYQCFTLLQLLYRWRHKSRIFLIPPHIFCISSVKVGLHMELFHQSCEWRKLQVYTALWKVGIHSTVQNVRGVLKFSSYTLLTASWYNCFSCRCVTSSSLYPLITMPGCARHPCCVLNAKVENRFVISFVGEVLQRVLIMPRQGSCNISSFAYGAYMHPEFRT